MSTTNLGNVVLFIFTTNLLDELKGLASFIIDEGSDSKSNKAG